MECHLIGTLDTSAAGQKSIITSPLIFFECIPSLLLPIKLFKWTGLDSLKLHRHTKRTGMWSGKLQNANFPTRLFLL